MQHQDIFRWITVREHFLHSYLFYKNFWFLHKSLTLETYTSHCLQFEATTRTGEQSCRESTILRGWGARTGVLLVTIRTERTTKGAGGWQVLVVTVIGGVLQAQVHPRCSTLMAICIFRTVVNVSVFQMDQDRRGGGKSQISVAVSPLMPEKMSVATGGRIRAAAAWRMRGTACLSGVWKTQKRRQGPSTHRGLFSLSRWDEMEEFLMYVLNFEFP